MVNLKVAEQYPSDRGKGIVRIHPATVQSSVIEEDDIVEVHGNRTTAAVVKLLDAIDPDDTARLDSFVRQNAKADVDTDISVRPTDAEPTERATLSISCEEVSQLEPNPSGVVLEQMIGRPITDDDSIPVSSSEDVSETLLFGTTEQIILSVTDSGRDGTAVVTDDTKIKIETKSES